MSANLVSMFYRREGGTPWHRGGTPVDGMTDLDQVLKTAGIKRVRKVPLYCKVAGKEHRVVTHAMIVDSDDAPLAVCGITMGLIQPDALMAIPHMLVERGQGVWETAGVLRGGKTIWGQVKVTNVEPFEVVKGDRVDPYFLATQSYDGSAAYMRWCETRVVCDNTRHIALFERRHREIEINDDTNDEELVERVYAVRVVHTPNAAANLERAADAMGIGIKAWERNKEVSRAFAKARMNSAALEAFFERIIPDDPEIQDNSRRERARSELMEIAEVGKGTNIPGVRGTLWGAVNAVTEWADHGRGSIGGTDPDPTKAPDAQKRLTSIFMGSGARVKAKATRVAMEIIAAA